MSLTKMTAPKPSADYYERRLRRCIVPMHVLEGLLSLDGEHSYRMDGWPAGAKIVGADIHKSPFSVVCYLFHPDFDIVPHGMLPRLVKVTARAVA